MGELESKLENAARYIIETSARNTTSGNYITYTGDVPEEIISPELFSKHIQEIADIMQEYEAVLDIDVESGESIDVVMGLAYCPNYEPWDSEREEYPDDREIFDPLKTRLDREDESESDCKFTKKGEWFIDDVRADIEEQKMPENFSEGDTLYYMEKDGYYIDVTLNYDTDDNLAVFYEIGRIDEIGTESEKSVDIPLFDISSDSIVQDMKDLIDEYKKERDSVLSDDERPVTPEKAQKPPHTTLKPSLMDKVEAGKQKAALQAQPDKEKNKKQEVLE